MKLLIPFLFLFVFQVFAEDGERGYVPDFYQQAHAQHRDYRSRGLKGALPLPKEYDLRKIGNGTAPVRNQGGCGSCWMFGTKGVVESLVRLRDGKDIEVSGQWGIDCKPANFDGCRGGDFAFDKFKKGFGTIYESEYTYKYSASNRACDNSFLKPANYHETIVDWALIDNSVESMQRAMFENESPLGVTIGSGGMAPGKDGWQESCRTAGTDHIVYLVGWLEGSLHGHKAGVYWILQNSWGTSWGDKGYEYILARSGSTICSSLGAEEVALANYKPACTPQPTASAGLDKNIILKGK